MVKPIQEQFGQRVIDVFADFARADLKSVAELEADEFAHIGDTNLRHHLAQVFYGSRWIYKLGLAMLTTDEERAAHIRAQLVDYASIVEATLSDAIRHAIVNGHTAGDGWNWKDPDKKTQRIRWNTARPDLLLGKQSFWWLIRVATDFGVLTKPFDGKLNRLREYRNQVHVRQRAAVNASGYLGQSREAYELMYKTIAATKHWRDVHP